MRNEKKIIEFHLHVQHDEIARVPYRDLTERHG